MPASSSAKTASSASVSRAVGLVDVPHDHGAHAVDDLREAGDRERDAMRERCAGHVRAALEDALRSRLERKQRMGDAVRIAAEARRGVVDEPSAAGRLDGIRRELWPGASVAGGEDAHEQKTGDGRPARDAVCSHDPPPSADARRGLLWRRGTARLPSPALRARGLGEAQVQRRAGRTG